VRNEKLEHLLLQDDYEMAGRVGECLNCDFLIATRQHPSKGWELGWKAWAWEANDATIKPVLWSSKQGSVFRFRGAEMSDEFQRLCLSLSTNKKIEMITSQRE
jgi:hypothetical protein